MRDVAYSNSDVFAHAARSARARRRLHDSRCARDRRSRRTRAWRCTSTRRPTRCRTPASCSAPSRWSATSCCDGKDTELLRLRRDAIDARTHRADGGSRACRSGRRSRRRTAVDRTGQRPALRRAISRSHARHQQLLDHAQHLALRTPRTRRILRRRTAGDAARSTVSSMTLRFVGGGPSGEHALACRSRCARTRRRLPACAWTPCRHALPER